MPSVRLNFKGLMCPVFTAFSHDKKRTIRFDVIDKYANWLNGKGINGVLMNGTTGEGVCMTTDERKRSLEHWLSSCRKYNLKSMVQIGGTSITDVRTLAEHAENNKVDACLCLPELFFKPTCEEDLVHYLKDIAEHCPTRPFFYYHFPAFSRVNLSMPRFCDLAERDIPTFGGIKFTSGDLNEGTACLKLGRRIFLGSNVIFSGALMLGFDSAILISLNICPELAIECYQAMQENDFPRAQTAQAKLTKRFNECGGSIKDVFNQINSDFDCGPSRKPALGLNKK